MPATPLPPNLMGDIQYPPAPPFPTTAAFPIRSDYDTARKAYDAFNNQPYMLVGCNARTVDVCAHSARRLVQIGYVRYMVSRGTWQVWYDYPHSAYLQQMGGEESPSASHGVQRILDQAYQDSPQFREFPIFCSTR